MKLVRVIKEFIYNDQIQRSGWQIYVEDYEVEGLVKDQYINVMYVPQNRQEK